MAGGKKDASRDLAAVALAAGKTSAEAGAAAGVSERTVQNWKAEPAFAARVSELRGEMVSGACGVLAGAMGGAARKLQELTGSTTESIALRASTEILNAGLKVREMVELQSRLEELERRVGGQAQ